MRESHSWTKSNGGTRADPEEKFVAHNSHFYVLSEIIFGNSDLLCLKPP